MHNTQDDSFLFPIEDKEESLRIPIEDEEESLGILETDLIISILNSSGETIRNRSFNLHYYFSFYDNNLICRCLDFNIYTRLKIEASQSNDSLTNFVKDIIFNVSKELTLDIIDYLNSNLAEIGKSISIKDVISVLQMAFGTVHVIGNTKQFMKNRLDIEIVEKILPIARLIYGKNKDLLPYLYTCLNYAIRDKEKHQQYMKEIYEIESIG